jgi:hypothetical protein
MNTLTLPFPIANEVIERMTNNPNCMICLIAHNYVGNVIKTSITYRYNYENN